MNSIGGKAVASGAYGCVFKPALKCKGKAAPGPGTISKLMTIKYANAEFDEIEKFSHIITKIPNFQKYFLIEPIELCVPNKLSSSDKTDFDKKCGNLVKKGFKATTINKGYELSKLRIINMPDGGIDIDDYFKDNVITNEMLHMINENFKDILLNAILPMNEVGLYHLDVKAGNLLIDSHKQIRIVDWGLSGISTNKKAPDILRGRPVQYNCPFSSLFINSMFLPDYKAYLKHTGTSYKLRLREFVINFYDKWSKHRGTGHEDYIEYIVKNIFLGKLPGIKNQSDIIKYNVAKAFIYNFLVANLETFTKDGEFQENEFMEVFLYNVDIWGLLMCYEPIFYYARKKPPHVKLTPREPVLSQLMNILLKYCFDNPVEKIPITSLVNDINHINKLLKVPGAKTSKKPVKKPKKLTLIEVRPSSPKPPPSSPKPPPSKTKKKRTRCPNGTRKNKNPPPNCLPK